MLKSDRIFLKLILMTILTIITFLLFSSLAIAQSIPPYIYYQGRLLDQATGAPINQIKSVTLYLYDTSSGGVPIYSQTKQVTITNGVFSVYLGKGEGYYAGNTLADGIPSEVFTEYTAMYLGIMLSDSQVEMTPRQLIASVAYAYKAEKANEAEHVMGQVIVDPNTGNVGIGTTSPSELLHVYGPDGTGAVVKLPEIQSARDDGDIYIHPNSGRNVYMGFNNALNVINGNVGIGTTSPQELLHAKGNVRIENGNTSKYVYLNVDDTLGGLRIIPSDSGSAALTINQNGNVGINTGSPTANLMIKEESPDLGYSQLRVESAGGSGTFEIDVGSGRAAIGTVTNQALSFVTGGISNDRITIDTAGNVGIGTTEPEARLHIKHANISPKLWVEGDVRFGGSTHHTDVAIQTTGFYFWIQNPDGPYAAKLSNNGIWMDASDIAYKKDIQDIDYGLDTVMKLEPRKYKMKSNDLEQIGFIAQEIEEVLPEVVSGEDGNKTLSYGQITAVLTQAVKELNAKHEAAINILKAENEVLRAEISALKVAIQH